MSLARCPGCGCGAASNAHALIARLQADDVDGAIDGGLLDAGPCAHCAATCTSALLQVRDARRVALAARERFRLRERRLVARAAKRDAARVKAPPGGVAAALPSAAAAALQRALARARKD